MMKNFTVQHSSLGIGILFLAIFAVAHTSFNDIFSVSPTIQQQLERWYVNDELKRAWKDAVVA
jgi:hypothetical protein